MGIIDSLRKKSTLPGKDGAKPVAKKTTKAKAKDTESTVTAKDETLSAAGPGSEMAFRLIRRPHVSEKAGRLSQKGVYVFEVALEAEKIEIKKAIESLYKVKIVSIRTMRQAGKPIYRGRRAGARRDSKKAYIALAPGQKLQVYEGV